jgi:proteasome accessory factor A
VPLFGIETEYGLAIEGRGAAEQIDDAADFVSGYPKPCFVGWDYGCESPRRDLRGYTVGELAHDPVDAKYDKGGTRTFDRDTHVDRVLRNGARFYNDHGHPEYATPECSRLMDLVAHDLAGEATMRLCAEEYERSHGRAVSIYKNNTDYHGASYGTHENYLFPRNVAFESLQSGLLPFLAVRPILVGGGKVGSDAGAPCRFQLSQRAEHSRETANIETLYRRPLLNTRDEPHADARRFRRVHMICGDANRMQWATAMKFGMTSLVLRLISSGQAPSWRLANVRDTVETISKDESFAWRVSLEGGSWTTGVHILESYLEASAACLTNRDAESSWVMDEWRRALDDVSHDPRSLSDRVDWAAKLAMFDEFSEGGAWDIAEMQSLELQYHNIDPSQSLFDAWRTMGRTTDLVDDQRVMDALESPPQNTRAFNRGALVSEGDPGLVSLSWSRAVYVDHVREFDLSDAEM